MTTIPLMVASDGIENPKFVAFKYPLIFTDVALPRVGFPSSAVILLGLVQLANVWPTSSYAPAPAIYVTELICIPYVGLHYNMHMLQLKVI